MKTIKMFQIVFTITVLSIVIGCSDQFTSPESVLRDIAGNESVNHATGSSADNRYTVQIKLKPFRSYTFNLNNTGLKKFYAINAENVSANYISINRNTCQDISVYSKNSLQDSFIGCKSSGLDLSEITIENLSSKMIDVNVILTGVKGDSKLK